MFFFVLLYILLLLIVAYLVLLERKLLRLAQLRKRPNIVGLYRILQTVIDRVKLLLKKFLILSNYIGFFFLISPLYSFFLSLVLWCFPFLRYSFSTAEFNLFLIFTLMSLNGHTLV